MTTNAGQFFTLADERNGYTKTRAALHTYTDAELFTEYHQSVKDNFGQMFDWSARRFLNLVVDELFARGITHAPNIFGPIQIKRHKG
jgi:hypothetical protein